MDREPMSLEVPIELDLSFETWFRHDGKGVIVAVLESGVNEVVKREYTWKELYDDIEYDVSVESEQLRPKARQDILRHKKKVLKEMVRFVDKTGYKPAKR